MKHYSTIRKQLIAAFATIALSSSGYSQTCPGFEIGLPISNLYTVSFFNLEGILVVDCTCQLSGGTFKCGVCLPILFTTYRYVFGGEAIECTNPGILPVELRHFDALVSNGDVGLTWSTETERDNQEFIVERSEDAIDYVIFGKVPGAGNSTEPLNYSLSDTDPLRGISYYRISQRDINGTVTQLATVSVELSSAVPGTVLAPNPSLGRTVLQLPLHVGEEVFDVVISNEFGQIVRSFQTQEDTALELTSGVYRVVVLCGAQVWAEKVVITD